MVRFHYLLPILIRKVAQLGRALVLGTRGCRFKSCLSDHFMYYTYIVECCDKTFYTGYTNDLNKRVQTHNKGKGAKYTRHRLPVVLVYSEEFNDRSSAMKREYAIKQLSRTDKKNLIISNGK
jgi:putative endonuclease